VSRPNKSMQRARFHEPRMGGVGRHRHCGDAIRIPILPKSSLNFGMLLAVLWCSQRGPVH